MLRQIASELKHHVPFTALGALSGIIIMVIIVLTNVSSQVSQASFDILHPVHVVLSAIVTTAMYKKHSNGKIWAAILLGYSAAIGVATISDALMPYLGAALLGVNIEFHVPFIETAKIPFIGLQTWKLVNSAALLGIIIGYLRPTTKLPHAAHILVSTWATLLYFTAFGIADWIPRLPLIFLFLFLAVWIPCCTSDIVFPLLFAREKLPHQEV